MNSDPTNSPTDPSISPSMLTLPNSSSSETSWMDAPLDSILEAPVHEMSPTELAEFVKTCAAMRSSAQTRKKALTTEAVSLGQKKKPTKAKNNVDAAMALLNQLK